MVVRTSPVLESGEPFPTLYWLTCPLAIRALSTLEHAGAMRSYNERLADDPEVAAAYRGAHERYLQDRDGDAQGESDSVGGMPARVKCLHALYAHELADANPIGALVRERVEPLGCPGPCVSDADGPVAAVPGHPGFRGLRKR